jgi:uncharacterized membrane protein (DUF485 family)
LDNETAKRIQDNPKFQELVQKRGSFAWLLAIIMLIIYYSFIMTIAFSPETLGSSLSEGVMTIGIPIGIAIIFIAFALTGIYTSRANSEFDRLTNEIKEEIRHG